MTLRHLPTFSTVPVTIFLTCSSSATLHTNEAMSTFGNSALTASSLSACRSAIVMRFTPLRMNARTVAAPIWSQFGIYVSSYARSCASNEGDTSEGEHGQSVNVGGRCGLVVFSLSLLSLYRL